MLGHLDCIGAGSGRAQGESFRFALFAAFLPAGLRVCGSGACRPGGTMRQQPQEVERNVDVRSLVYPKWGAAVLYNLQIGQTAVNVILADWLSCAITSG